VPLPENLLRKPKELDGLRNSYGHDWLGWAKWVPHLGSLAGQPEITIDALPGISFKISGEKVVPISFKSGSPSFTLDLDGEVYKKLYLLVIPYQENHDTFAPVARISVRSENGVILSRMLYTPGDLDWARAAHPILTTAIQPYRNGRFDLLPILSSHTAGWEQARPPAFPQPEFWATCISHKTPSAAMNVIEIDLEKPQKLKSLNITTTGVDSSLGLVAVSAETTGNIKLLQGTKWMPSYEYVGPLTVFALQDENSVKDWTLEGNAFSVSSTAWLQGTPTLNSVVTEGETAVGKAISPDFILPENFDTLQFQYHGGISDDRNGQGLLCIDLIDTANNERLYRYHVKVSSPVLKEGVIPMAQWSGQTVRLELVDSNTNPSFAWMGVKNVQLLPKTK